MARSAANMIGVAASNDFPSIDDSVISSGERLQPGEQHLELPNWAIPQATSMINKVIDEESDTGLMESEKDKVAWDSSREKLYPINLGRNEFTDNEAIKFGLEGLIPALEKSIDGYPPIVSQDHLDVDLLKKCITEM